MSPSFVTGFRVDAIVKLMEVNFIQIWLVGECWLHACMHTYTHTLHYICYNIKQTFLAEPENSSMKRLIKCTKEIRQFIHSRGSHRCSSCGFITTSDVIYGVPPLKKAPKVRIYYFRLYPQYAACHRMYVPFHHNLRTRAIHLVVATHRLLTILQ
jgi:hypothetical protein